MIRSTLCALAFLSLCASAQAADDTECHPFKAASASAETRGWMTVEVRGALVTEFVAAFNAEEPVTNLQPAHVYGALNPQSPLGAVILVDKDGCVMVPAIPAPSHIVTDMVQGSD